MKIIQGGREYLERQAKKEYDSINKSLVTYEDLEYKSQLNIPFTHQGYSKFDRNLNVVGTNSHTASKPFIYQDVSRYYDFEAKKSANQDSILLVEKKIKGLIRRKYLYTTNFAINNSTYEVAPYIALTELVDANVKLLDTINKALSVEVKNSKYGKQLDKFIASIKENEK